MVKIPKNNNIYSFGNFEVNKKTIPQLRKHGIMNIFLFLKVGVNVNILFDKIWLRSKVWVNVGLGPRLLGTGHIL